MPACWSDSKEVSGVRPRPHVRRIRAAPSTVGRRKRYSAFARRPWPTSTRRDHAVHRDAPGRRRRTLVLAWGCPEPRAETICPEETQQRLGISPVNPNGVVGHRLTDDMMDRLRSHLECERALVGRAISPDEAAASLGITAKACGGSSRPITSSSTSRPPMSPRCTWSRLSPSSASSSVVGTTCSLWVA